MSRFTSGAETAWPLRRIVAAAGLVLISGASAAASDASAAQTTESLVQLLEANHTLTHEQAQALLQQLQQDAAGAAAGSSGQPAAPGTAPAATPADHPPVRVMYIPEVEKQKLRDELRQEVMAQARAENWAQPESLPAWTRRLHLSGDLRLREDVSLLDSANDPYLIDFAAVNSGSPLDINPDAGDPLHYPFLNTTKDRQRLRLRARLDFKADIAQNLDADLRIATGGSNPVSRNVTLSNGASPDLGLDRAEIHYAALAGLDFRLGRMGNPIRSTDLVFDDDLSLDGLAVQWQMQGESHFKPFANVAGFTLQSTGFDFPDNSYAKVSSRDQWLLALQGGVSWQFKDDMKAEFAVGYYDFVDLQGRLSSDCQVASSADACDTDNTRPNFEQKGNTLFALRSLLVDASDTDGPQYQYFGYATDFRVLDFNTSLDWTLDNGTHVTGTLSFVTNLAFDRSDIEDHVPVNNYSVCDADDDDCEYHFDGGHRAWQARLLVGSPQILLRGQWNATAAYRYVETDAVPDAYTDSDFNLGGTNGQGFVIGGTWGLTDNSALAVRWLSGKEVSSSPLSTEVIFVDFNVRF